MLESPLHFFNFSLNFLTFKNKQPEKKIFLFLHSNYNFIFKINMNSTWRYSQPRKHHIRQCIINISHFCFYTKFTHIFYLLVTFLPCNWRNFHDQQLILNKRHHHIFQVRNKPETLKKTPMPMGITVYYFPTIYEFYHSISNPQTIFPHLKSFLLLHLYLTHFPLVKVTPFTHNTPTQRFSLLCQTLSFVARRNRM